MARAHRILLPTDFSPESARAYRRAIELAKTNRAELLLVHVTTPPPVVGYVDAVQMRRVNDAAEAYAQKRLDDLVARAERTGVRTKGLMLRGVPSRQIIQAARSQKADLIVMGTKPTGLARVVLGSISRNVIATAPCLVMTVGPLPGPPTIDPPPPKRPRPTDPPPPKRPPRR
jgi:nucleotide-binding universal stress UspA family protein